MKYVCIHTSPLSINSLAYWISRPCCIVLDVVDDDFHVHDFTHVDRHLAWSGGTEVATERSINLQGKYIKFWWAARMLMISIRYNVNLRMFLLDTTKIYIFI